MFVRKRINKRGIHLRFYVGPSTLKKIRNLIICILLNFVRTIIG